MARKVRIDMGGVRHGRLIGIAYSHSEGGHAHWLFHCDCGAETIANGASVRAGNTASCGCLHREISAGRLLRHGHRAAKRHGPTYRAWQQINGLCTNPALPRYRDFGARGIAVCEAWRADFQAFLADMGERPARTILRLIDPAGDFAPGNCSWVVVHNDPPRHGEGDHAQHGGGGSPQAHTQPHAPSTTPLRVAVPLPVPGRI